MDEKSHDFLVKTENLHKKTNWKKLFIPLQHHPNMNFSFIKH